MCVYSDHWSREHIREVFFRAQKLRPGQERRKFLESVCGEDTALLAEVRALLQADDSSGDLLSRDISGELFCSSSGLIGQTIDCYRIAARLGDGGFGEVYQAEQLEPFRREVALKIIKLGMDSAEVVARFRAERQALALMDHPNIAHIYDAGITDSGRPYFVMELIHGVPLTEYCDQHRLSLPDRLHLFLQVCDAVHHAHEKGVIHRDLKPANIMVDDTHKNRLCKVIDFGIAKALEGSLTEYTLITLQEMRMGSPRYMSPELLKRDGREVDVRSDVYSLGIILYELLSGTTPLAYDMPTPVRIDEMRQALETKAILRPSRVLRAVTNGADSIADARQVKLPALEKLLRGDLDWIVMKAIDIEWGRRYESVGALAEDLEHYLKNEPISAGPPSASCRLRKFVKRHNTVTRVAWSVLVTLIVALGFFLWLTKPAPVVCVPGWKLEKFYELGELGSNGLAVRSDGSVLVVGEWSHDSSPIPMGLYLAVKGGVWSERDVFSIGPEYIDPEHAVELPDGIYVTVNATLEGLQKGGSGKVLRVPFEGGEPAVLCGYPIHNPYGIAVAPVSFDGPNVDPGDLLICDNAQGEAHTAIWSVKRSTGEVRPLVVGNHWNRGFLDIAFSPDGVLYTSLNDDAAMHGILLKITPEGEVETVFDNFTCKKNVADQLYRIQLSIHPVTGEIFFCTRQSIYAFIPGITEPRLVLSKGEELQWAPDGSKLYVIADKAIWTLTGPDIASRFVSIVDK